MTTPINWLIAIALCILVGAAHHLDADDNHGDWAESQELKALQATEADTESRNRAAQDLCNTERGPNSEARWTAEGDLVCTTRRGLVAVQL